MDSKELFNEYEELQNKAIMYDDEIQSQRAAFFLEMFNTPSMIADIKNNLKTSTSIDTETLIDVILQVGKLRGMSAYAIEDAVSSMLMRMASDLLNEYSEMIDKIIANREK